MSHPYAPLRILVIGCGRMGRLHTERLHADGRARVTGLIETSQGRALAERLRDTLAPGATVSTDLADLLDRQTFDAAVVCTPTPFHFEQIAACRRRGLSILCEKPLTDTRERIEKLTAAANAGGPVLSVAYQRRYWAVYRKLRQEVQSGRWGPVRALTSNNAERWQQTIAGTWRDDPAVNVGGFVGDAGSHKIDIIFYVTGLKPVEVFARSDTCGSRVEVVTMVAARLEGGVPVSMNFIGNAESFGEDLHVHCAEADLLLRNGRLWIGRNNQLEPVDITEADADPDAGFLDVLIDEADDLAPPACALPVYDFTQAILESGRTGQVVRL